MSRNEAWIDSQPFPSLSDEKRSQLLVPTLFFRISRDSHIECLFIHHSILRTNFVSRLDLLVHFGACQSPNKNDEESASSRRSFPPASQCVCYSCPPRLTSAVFLRALDHIDDPYIEQMLVQLSHFEPLHRDSSTPKPLLLAQDVDRS